MNDQQEMQERCAAQLLTSVERACRLNAFIGLDGFVDEICRVVDTRDDAEHYSVLTSIPQFAERIAGAAGRSTNLEIITERVKLGGNGPIMANALANFGIRVTYIGSLGYPAMNPIFNDFASRAEVHTIANPGHTTAIEFEDGKVMLGKTEQLSEITWPNIQLRFGRQRFIQKFATADLVGFVNWTMIPYMSDVFAALQTEFCPTPTATRRKIFFDLADPEKRTPDDLCRALKLIAGFETYFEVILGLNEKEALEVASAMGLPAPAPNRDGLAQLCRELHAQIGINTLVVHPVTYALAVTAGHVSVMDGPHIPKPAITTGAGDHFNAGFCLGKLLGFDNALALLVGVTSSGYYVKNARTANLTEMAQFLRNWPMKES